MPFQGRAIAATIVNDASVVKAMTEFNPIGPCERSPAHAAAYYFPLEINDERLMKVMQ